ncbi:DegT/DnrJ/EryC1/StrS family aminotransferase [Thermoflexus sp.]|uniref:DegT/DnrJ/EryC1/StrS family aminotransferase n=1 Tax=Thermoflexus sp. TaxID=1969742 RepID=UPI003A0FEED6
MGEEEIAEVVDTLRSGWIGMGPKTARFEQLFRDYVGSRHAVAVSSGTAALHLSLIACGIGPGDEVITTPLTFPATANVILHQGATPVFVDIDEQTLNIDPALVEERITPRTRAIIPVHFGGLPCEMDRLMQIARRHALYVIEDAAHALGARYRGRLIGTIGDFTAFSFYANKNITTAEGGMVTTHDDVAADLIRAYRLHGMTHDAWIRFQSKNLVFSEAIYPGYKYNMTDIQASLGIHQLKRLEAFLDIRERYAARYDEAFADLPGVSIPPRMLREGDRHALHLYLLILDVERLKVDRDEIVRALRAENIGAAVHYKPVHLHPYYRQRFGFRGGEFPKAERIAERLVSLPLSPKMTPRDVDSVILAVRRVIGYYLK